MNADHALRDGLLELEATEFGQNTEQIKSTVSKRIHRYRRRRIFMKVATPVMWCLCILFFALPATLELQKADSISDHPHYIFFGPEGKELLLVNGEFVTQNDYFDIIAATLKYPVLIVALALTIFVIINSRKPNKRNVQNQIREMDIVANK